MKKMEIIIIGAGAAGLMAAYELSKAGKKVLILEARNRIGGRICPLPESEFGYPAQAGAEFVHGSAKVTKALVKAAGLTYVSMPQDGQMYNATAGGFKINSPDPTDNPELSENQELLHKKLKALKIDMPIAEFLENNFKDQKYYGMKDWINRMVTGFDAADPAKISTFSLRGEWLGQDEWEQGRIKEGYTSLLQFLESECRKLGVEILLNQKVISVDFTNEVKVKTDDSEYISEKVIITVPIPIINQIKFTPDVPTKLKAAETIGFGQVIKILLNFKERFWINARGQDLDKMVFVFSDQPVGTWWTQYPQRNTTLTGWISGPKALKFKNKTDTELVDDALESLSKIFDIGKDKLKQLLVVKRVANWPADPLAQGAYSYTTAGSEKAYTELRKPENGKLYFAGEAVYEEKETATVEGALASGLAVAQKIIK